MAKNIDLSTEKQTFHVKQQTCVARATLCAKHYILVRFSCNNGYTSKMDQESTKDTLAIGRLGECVAAKYLEDLGFQVIIRNYRKKYGEIDIVAQKKDTVHFVEVKTVSHGTRRELESLVTRETWHPEELVHYSKLRQIKKAAESWILEHSWAGAVQIDVAAVRMVPREKFATVNLISNVGLD